MEEEEAVEVPWGLFPLGRGRSRHLSLGCEVHAPKIM